MKFDCYGKSWPSTILEPSFIKAHKLVKKDGRNRYVFHDGTISLRTTKAEKLSRQYWIVAIDVYIHATEPWIKMDCPKFAEVNK